MKTIASVMLGSLLLASHVVAGEVTGDRWKIGIGGYALSDFDANMTLESAASGAGLSISPIETLGMDFDTTVFRMDGRYRISDAHGLQFSWYRISSNGYKILGKDIEWGEIVIPASAEVNSELKYDIFKLGYLWSFYHNDKVELGVGGGIHATRLSLALQARSSGGTHLDTQDVDTTVPLPVVMFMIAYRIDDKWSWSIENQWFSMNFETIRGAYNDSTVRIEYQAWDNVSLGVGLGVNNLFLEDDNGDYIFRYRNRIAGGMLYVATNF